MDGKSTYIHRYSIAIGYTDRHVHTYCTRDTTNRHIYTVHLIDTGGLVLHYFLCRLRFQMFNVKDQTTVF